MPNQNLTNSNNSGSNYNNAQQDNYTQHQPNTYQSPPPISPAQNQNYNNQTNQDNFQNFSQNVSNDSFQETQPQHNESTQTPQQVYPQNLQQETQNPQIQPGQQYSTPQHNQSEAVSHQDPQQPQYHQQIELQQDQVSSQQVDIPPDQAEQSNQNFQPQQQASAYEQQTNQPISQLGQNDQQNPSTESQQSTSPNQSSNTNLEVQKEEQVSNTEDASNSSTNPAFNPFTDESKVYTHKDPEQQEDKHAEYMNQASKDQDEDSSDKSKKNTETPEEMVAAFHSKNYYDDVNENQSFIRKLLFGSLKGVFDIIQVFVIAFAIFIVFYLFIVSPHTIDGQSMMPNFCNGDLILADKLTPKFNKYKVGDVIVFKYNEENDYIKRIVGVAGDTVMVQDGKVYRNGELLDESYLPPTRVTLLNTAGGLQEGVPYTVPEGKYMVFGDNRPRSTDSRAFLAIDPAGTNEIKGRVRFVLWPLSRARIFNEAEGFPEDACAGVSIE